MQYKELIILVPCHSLEDFPLYHTGDDAAGLLAAWTALWHPALLDSAGSMPSLQRADAPPGELSNRLILVPTASEDELDPDLAKNAAGQQAVLVRGQTCRKRIATLALDSLDGGDAGVAPQVTADFFALGFCYLQVELLTRQMRYSSSLDESSFRSNLLAAARAAIQGDVETAGQHLTSCFDALADERNHYYPVDVYLIDLTVVAASTVGDLRCELKDGRCLNLLLSGQTLEHLAHAEPQTLAELRNAVATGNARIVGGEYAELALPLLSLDTIIRQLQKGAITYQDHLGQTPTVFGRRRFGLVPELPQILQQCGFAAALHATLDDGRFPESSQYKTRWEGPGGGTLDALARAPLDASRPETFLNLPTQLSESMDMDHVATRCFAHWPGKGSVWYDDLRRAAELGSALGKFVTLEEYFSETGDTGQHERFEASAYRSPYLQQAVAGEIPNPLSRIARYWQQHIKLCDVRALDVMSLCVDGTGDESVAAEQRQKVEQLRDDIDLELESISAQSAAVPDEMSIPFAENLVQRVAGGAAAEGADGLTIVNPLSFVRRVVVDTTSLASAPDLQKPIYATASGSGGRRLTVVDVPPMGMARISSGQATAKVKPTPQLAEDNVLRNEFLQAHIDPTTGTLRSITDYTSRGTRLSQQLAMRIAPPKTGQPWIDHKLSARYSVMSANSVNITENNAIRAEITTSGRLLDETGQNLADFVQRYGLSRGSRILTIEIELQPHRELGDDPWDSYFACRFAWPDEAALLSRGVRLQRYPAGGGRIEAPLFVDVDNEPRHTLILSGGLPYHRRVDLRQLDTLLLVRGETARRFRVGIGLDVGYPVRAAMEFLAPEPMVVPTSGGTRSEGSWLFHLDAKNVIATDWRPLLQDRVLRGVRVRLLETEGRSANLRFHAYRPVLQARLVGFDGQPRADCTVEDGVVQLQLDGREYCELEVLTTTT